MDWIQILGLLLTVLIAFIVGMFYGGIARKITAKIQNRVGPPIYQNFIDVIKLYSKESAINHGVMQHVGPVFAISASISTLFFVPILTSGNFFTNFSFNGELVFLIYIMVFGQLGMALGVGQAANPNGAIGVSRGLSQMVGYEIPWVLAIVALMIQYKTTSVAGLMDAQAASGVWTMFTSPFAFLAGLMAFMGMMHYAPFDIAHAPAELASGPPSEFGGKYLALMMTSGSIFTFVKLVLFINIFMGGADNLLILLAKTFVIYLVPLIYGIVSPRYRTEQSIRYFWGWPSVLGVIGLLSAWYVM